MGVGGGNGGEKEEGRGGYNLLKKRESVTQKLSQVKPKGHWELA